VSTTNWLVYFDEARMLYVAMDGMTGEQRYCTPEAVKAGVAVANRPDTWPGTPPLLQSSCTFFESVSSREAWKKRPPVVAPGRRDRHCEWCGGKFIEDSRGCCGACGGPVWRVVA
jgi:hypothetical protein